jgi:hypothetical protein
MNYSLILSGAVLTLLAVGGCDRAQSPAEVRHDVTSAANSAADSNALAGEKQDKVAATVNKDLGVANQQADAKTASAAADMAVTVAEGEHKVAMARCEALAGDARTACHDEADASLDLARAKAKAARAIGG